MKTVMMLACLAVFLGTPAFGELVFQDDFSDDLNGPDGPGSPPIGQSWTITESPPNAEVKIDSGFMVISRGSTATSAPTAVGDLTPAAASTYTGGTFTSDFVLYKTNAGSSAALFIVAPENNGNRLVSVVFQDDGDVEYFNGASFTDTGLDYTVASFDNNVSIAVDCSSYTATVSVNGNTTPGSTNFPFLNNENTMDGLLFTPGKGGFAFIDNVNVNAVPEPVSAGLLVGCLGGMILRRRNRS